MIQTINFTGKISVSNPDSDDANRPTGQGNDNESFFSKIKLIFKRFIKLTWPERLFVLRYVCKIEQIEYLSNKALEVASKMANDPDLDGDSNGGQVDAFRHAFWMAIITKAFSSKIANNLGVTHEKANRIMYLRGKLEDGALADRMACEMDLKNNEIGIRIASKNPNISENELIDLIKDMITNGQLWIIKKNKDGKYLDWYNNILVFYEYSGKWYNKRCLVPSDYKHEL